MGERFSPASRTRTEQTAAADNAPRPYLICVGSSEDDFSDAGRVVPLGGAQWVRFGRSPASGLIVEQDGAVVKIGIPLAWVSGRHAELTLDPSPIGAHTLRDLKSRNGTVIEGQRLDGSRPLAYGQVFELGRSFWIVRESAGVLSDADSVVDGTGSANPLLAPVLNAVEGLAESDVPVLFTGETGCGKDHLARALHRLSGSKGRMVAVNLASAKLERLLGDASDGKWSRIEAARGGTLFLNEVSELDDRAQTQLLSILGGSGLDENAPIRLVAASSRDLRRLVQEGQFRADLYARLSGYEAYLPPVRERREDLGRLVRAVLRPLSDDRVGISTGAFRRVLGHGWPFNIRELGQALRAALAISSRRGTVNLGALEQVLQTHDPSGLSPARIQAVREELMRSLRTHGPNVQALAEALGASEEQIERWLKRFELTPSDYAN